MLEYLLIPAGAFAVTYLLTPGLARKLAEAGISGKDMNKEGNPEVPEMGGLAITAGFVAGVLLGIGLISFEMTTATVGLKYILAALSTVLIMTLIGVIDDLIMVEQHVKAALPLLAALPLMAVKAGTTVMTLPLLGEVNFGIFYVFVLIPIAITGASNAMNMLAGFNGLEAGLGMIMCLSIAIVSFITGSTSALIISTAMLGALIGFIRYNWYPAKTLIGDVGTLTIGAVVASSVLIGNIEKAGIILIIPFFLELVLKMRGRFKAQSWCDVRGKKLVCQDRNKIYGWGRLVMYLSKGIGERNLVLTILAVEALFGAAAVISFL